MRFERKDGRWSPTAAGKPFFTMPGKSAEWEPSLRKVDGLGYLVYNRCKDRRGRVYQSADGLNYHPLFEHVNHTVPQSLNEGLDGSLYLATNTGPGWLRKPLLLFTMRGYSFVNPVVVQDEKQIREDLKQAQPPREVPFVHHPMGTNVFPNGRWRHILLYRVCDLRETNGEGAPPTPLTGLYAVELEYDDVKPQPFFPETK